MNAWIINRLLALKMAAIKRFLWQPLHLKSHNPQQTQETLLLQILRSHKTTRFGREHRFEHIRSYEDFCKSVPVCNYENLRSYIEFQEADKSAHLNPQQPIMYAQTSGTSGAPKNIPVLNSTVKQFKQGQQITAYSIYRDIPEAYAGKILGITGAAAEGILNAGTPYGAISGFIYQSMPRIMQQKYVVPHGVFEIEDYQKKYYKIATLALAEENITMIATANPSTVLKVDQVINEHTEKIISEVRLINAERARSLQLLMNKRGELRMSDIWPHLKAIVTWTGGNCGVLVPKLQNRVPSDARFVELGYVASEFRGGITIDGLSNRQIPTFHDNFLEFVEKERWESNMPEFLRLHEIKPGRQYYIFPTTRNGLYRYNINDLIEVTGNYNNTPTIAFVQKGKDVTNLTGEKLCEGQLVQAMTDIIKNHQFDIPFFKMLGNPEERQYTLFVSQKMLDIRDLDRRLCELNIEFNAKRKSGRLKPIRMQEVLGSTAEAYKKHCLARGQRESQFKMSYLQNVQDCTFKFDNYICGTSYAAQ